MKKKQFYETIDGHDCFATKIDDDSQDVFGKGTNTCILCLTNLYKGLNIDIDEEDEISVRNCLFW